MFVILATITFILGSVSGSYVANQYIENVLNTALQYEVRGLGLDPANIPDFTTEFEDKVAIIGKVKGKAEYNKGSLTGLSQIRRYSECQGPSYSFGNKTINCTLGFNNVSVNYEGKLKYGKVPKVNIKGKANATETLVFVEVTSGQFQSSSALKNFLFKQVGRLNIRFTGLGPLNKFTKFLEDGFRSHVEAEVFNSMSQKFQYALNRAVASVPMPN